MHDLRQTTRTHGQFCGGLISCDQNLLYVGPVLERSLGMKISLHQCPHCQMLIALYCNKPLWTVEIPSAMPTEARDTASI